MNEIVRHQHETNALVIATLKSIGRVLNMNYQTIKHKFIVENDDMITKAFWDDLWKTNKEYNQVDYCHGCKKFNLY